MKSSQALMPPDGCYETLLPPEKAGVRRRLECSEFYSLTALLMVWPDEVFLKNSSVSELNGVM